MIDGPHSFQTEATKKLENVCLGRDVILMGHTIAIKRAIIRWLSLLIWILTWSGMTYECKRKGYSFCERAIDWLDEHHPCRSFVIPWIT
jgi:hypothetical protein